MVTVGRTGPEPAAATVALSNGGVAEAVVVAAAAGVAPDAAPAAIAEGAAPLISVVMPCLNEEATIGRCVEKALCGIALTGLPGEVVVADNGSLDRSSAIATAAGAATC